MSTVTDAAGEITPDRDRSRRIGLDEAIYAAGKRPAQIEAIVAEALARGARLLITRLDADKLAQLPPQQQARLDYDPVSRTAILGDVGVPSGPARIAVVCAGSSDISVAREASRTLAYHHQAAWAVNDVGVAGLHRLLAREAELRRFPVVIAVAGMDAALASVIGGLLPGLVIGVPTSVGYGVATGGTSALHAMLASCAPGLVVTNIDNGYGAACAALRALGVLVADQGGAIDGRDALCRG